jgi:antibiotic biosynthesis monooxygenase (ABM) superfamily enzyme
MTAVLVPIVVAIGSVTGPLLRSAMGDEHAFLRLVVSATVQVVLMTYLIMPRVTRWLEGWLFRR